MLALTQVLYHAGRFPPRRLPTCPVNASTKTCHSIFTSHRCSSTFCGPKPSGPAQAPRARLPPGRAVVQRGADVDDRAAAGLAQLREGRARGGERAERVDLHHGAEAVRAQLLRGRLAARGASGKEGKWLVRRLGVLGCTRAAAAAAALVGPLAAVRSGDGPSCGTKSAFRLSASGATRTPAVLGCRSLCW
jgi:hypothetical protein